MVVLEMSYLVFTCDVNGTLQVLKSYTTLIKAGHMHDFPKEHHGLLSFTMKNKHGLRFSTCEEFGISPEQAAQILKEDLDNCKYVFAKGAGMEKIFLGGCTLQKGFHVAAHTVPVLDLEHLPGTKFSAVTPEELDTLPKCGDVYHQKKPDGSLNHCSLTDVHSFYRQLLRYIASINM
jgi:hypothetical protein